MVEVAVQKLLTISCLVPGTRRRTCTTHNDHHSTLRYTLRIFALPAVRTKRITMHCDLKRSVAMDVGRSLEPRPTQDDVNSGSNC